MSLSIIIVSYNTSKLLQDCLHSIYQAKPDLDFETIIIDNASTDDTISMLKANFPQVKVINNPKNLGFAAANNQGAKLATKDYLFFLNSDTVLNPNTLPALIQQTKSNQTSIASCRLNYPNGQVQPQGGSLPTLTNIAAWMLFLDDLPLIKHLFNPYQDRRPSSYLKDQTFGWLSGTALLVKTSTFKQLNGWDENIFMYGEDVEFCYRAAKQSLKIHYFSKPGLTHLGQGSGNSAKAWIGEYHGLIYLFQKHYPRWQLPVLKFLLALGAFLRLFIFGIMLKDEQKRHAYQKAFHLARS